jgi:hypothetical protein
MNGEHTKPVESRTEEKCVECGAGPGGSCGRSFMPGRCPAGKRLSDEHLLELARASAVDLRRTSRPTAAQAVEVLANEFEALKKRLRGINSLACYASEEDTDAQPCMLLKIGRVARGEEEVTWPTI